MSTVLFPGSPERVVPSCYSIAILQPGAATTAWICSFASLWGTCLQHRVGGGERKGTSEERKSASSPLTSRVCSGLSGDIADPCPKTRPQRSIPNPTAAPLGMRTGPQGRSDRGAPAGLRDARGERFSRRGVQARRRGAAWLLSRRVSASYLRNRRNV